MIKTLRLLLQCLLLPLYFFIFSDFFFFCQADVGTAKQYSPPYLPTECFANDASQFPPNNFFAAAGDGVWDNGASCGRQYLVRCVSATAPSICDTSTTIQVKIVDIAPSTFSGTTIVLSETAFGAIAGSATGVLNVEFQQV
ncbi:EG45-like domain containing protein [Carica papaya]|uniref:EG45-like domain containing protein n=1 Tax=Carica papaya TaxID=3649 RepID=UPI000B8CF582|nr:EG45-like domain containing protein [Carica papaya]